MSRLPVIEFRFKFESIEGKEYPLPIFYRPYESDDEKFLLMSLQSAKQKKNVDSEMVGFIDEFIKKCVIIDDSEKTGEIYAILDGMSYIDKIWMFFLIRAKSYSNMMSHSIKCDGCGQEFTTKIDIENDIKLSGKLNGKEEDIILPDNRKIKFILRTPKLKTFGMVLDLKEKWEKLSNENMDVTLAQLDDMYKQTDEMLYTFISNLVVDGTMYENETMEDFVVFAKPIPSQIKAGLLTKIMNSIPQFCINKTVVCDNAVSYTDESGVVQQKRCGKEHKIEEKGVISFL